MKPLISIASVTPTVCRLLGITPPALASRVFMPEVLQYIALAVGDAPLQKCLIFAPDAVGKHLWDRFPAALAEIFRHAPLQVPLRSVVPPKTPVCFASMFTGGQPEQHGIRHYERPVLECETLFDALASAGRRVVIVAVQDSSVTLIFRQRPIDYFTEADDTEVVSRTLKLLAENRHDVIVAYCQEYDDQLHATEPFSAECRAALRNHIRDFGRLAAAARQHWRGHRSAVIFAPDHGAHLEPATGHGDHGLGIPEDMNVYHCVRVWDADSSGQ